MSLVTTLNRSEIAPELICTETICFRATAAERHFIEQQAKRELRSVSNLIRSLVVERMQEAAA